MTMAGGGLRDPGRLTPPAKPAVPAAADPMMLATATAGVAMGIMILAPRYLPDQQALTASGTIIYNFAADRLVAIKNILGLSAEELGELASLASQEPAPTLPEVKDANTNNDPAQASPLANSLSRNGGSGKCEPNDHQEMEKRKDLFCSSPVKNALTCTSATSAWQNLVFARVHAICARQRDEINNKCFDGGDSGHRMQSQEAWRRVKKCLELIK